MSDALRVAADILRQEGLGDVAEWLGRPDLLRKALGNWAVRDEVEARLHDVALQTGVVEFVHAWPPAFYGVDYGSNADAPRISRVDRANSVITVTQPPRRNRARRSR